jgi:hypothetical protein
MVYEAVHEPTLDATMMLLRRNINADRGIARELAYSRVTTCESAYQAISRIWSIYIPFRQNLVAEEAISVSRSSYQVLMGSRL